MIGLDTNVFLRFLLQDDPVQSPIATRLIEAELTPETPGYVGVCTLIEIVWVLRRRQTYTRARLFELIDGLLSAETIVVGEAVAVERALRAFQRGSADFADHLIAELNAEAGCSRTVSFDRRAGAASPLVSLPTGA